MLEATADAKGETRLFASRSGRQWRRCYAPTTAESVAAEDAAQGDATEGDTGGPDIEHMRYTLANCASRKS